MQELSAEDSVFILDKLNNELMETWNNLSTNQPKDLVLEFGNSIKEMGEKFNIKMFKNYGTDIITALNSFDIESLLRLISQFPVMIEVFNRDLIKATD